MEYKRTRTAGNNQLDRQLDPTNTINEEIEYFDLNMPDHMLVKMLTKSLPQDVSYWNQKPWLLKDTDIENINYLLGDQLNDDYLLPHQVRYVDNRLHVSVRAILAYVTGQLAKPNLLPSKSGDRYERIAKNMENFLYQHALDHNVNREMRLATKNIITRKRGFLKLRFDKNYGAYGDIITENIDPADIVIDRFATFGDEPRKIHHRQYTTVEQLLAKFPDKQDDIFRVFGFKRGTYSQLSREITYWESWFTYCDKDGYDQEGVAWFLPNTSVVLGKMDNPNWIKKGSLRNQRIINITNKPIKPFVWMNYLNSGRSFIDETCLLDQAIPVQDILNRRGRQIVENADYANPRLLVDKRVMEESDAKKFVSKHPKTIGLVDTSATGDNIGNAVMQLPASQLPTFVFEDKLDARNEIDTIMGTPTQFRGDTATRKSPTLGQDLLVKNQASALQDDLVGVVNEAYRDYYTKLLQMTTVYLDDNYWLMTKGQDGQYVQLSMQDDNLDTNVKVGVQIDSNLPLDKQSQRATAIQLAQIPGRIDDLSLYEMLGLPDAEKLAARVQKYNVDRMSYMESIEQKLYNIEAETDITLVIANKEPEERDTYNERYLGHWNQFIASNRFQKLPPDVQQRLTMFLNVVANKAATEASLQGIALNPAGMLDAAQPMAAQVNPAEQTPGVSTQQPQNAIAGAEGGSPPAVTNPSQFGV